MRCKTCKKTYNTTESIPMIVNCGHTHCNKCITSSKNCLTCGMQIKYQITNYAFLDRILMKSDFKFYFY